MFCDGRHISHSHGQCISFDAMSSSFVTGSVLTDITLLLAAVNCIFTKWRLYSMSNKTLLLWDILYETIGLLQGT
jgi:ABC-type uncharacterized transport system involved in gliding motility auxiliary subunit